MSNSKKYIVTSLTLCAIGAVSAIAIAGTNLLTKNKIAENNAKSQNNALSVIFDDAKSYSEEKTDFKYTDSSYLVKYYNAYDQSNAELGYIYYVDGRNAYGEISMMVGINEEGIGQFSIVTNTQSFASTLEDNYITPIKNGDKTINDVSCGATYGAKLIRSMAYEANYDYQLQKGNTDVAAPTPEEPEVSSSENKSLDGIIASAKTYSDKKTSFGLSSPSYLEGYYVAYSESKQELGYIYETSGSNRYGTVELLVGIDSDGIGNFKVTKNTESWGSTLQSEYIEPVQSGSKDIDDVSCGATYGAKLIRDMAKEALNDYNTQKGGN